MAQDNHRLAEEIAAMDFQVQVDREDEHAGPPIFVAHITEIPVCVAQARSPEQEQAALRESLDDDIQYMLDSGNDVPRPRAQAGSVTAAQAG